MYPVCLCLFYLLLFCFCIGVLARWRDCVLGLVLGLFFWVVLGWGFFCSASSFVSLVACGLGFVLSFVFCVWLLVGVCGLCRLVLGFIFVFFLFWSPGVLWVALGCGYFGLVVSCWGLVLFCLLCVLYCFDGVGGGGCLFVVCFLF